MRKTCGVLLLLLAFPAYADPPVFTPGADGIGDPYLPRAGNGGYDVDHYHLEVTYDPATDQLTGRATITASATQNLSQFNLDLNGLTVDSVRVDHRSATFTRTGGELTVVPARGLRRHHRFETVVEYHGVPILLFNPSIGLTGFNHTADGAVVYAEPRVASSWFPVNDHPRDAARYTLDLTAPADREVIANGRLVFSRTRDGWTTWRWQPREPMASYLVSWTVGRYAMNSYREKGIDYVDAVDLKLFDPPFAPRRSPARSSTTCSRPGSTPRASRA